MSIVAKCFKNETKAVADVPSPLTLQTSDQQKKKSVVGRVNGP